MSKRILTKSKFIFATTALFYASNTVAFEKENWGYGAYLKSGSYTYDDPVANTDKTTASTPGFQLRYNPQIRGRRYLATLDFPDFVLKDSISGNLHSEVSGYQLTAGLQQRFNLSRDFKVWLGAAYGFGKVYLDDRYTVASDGFLDQTFKNTTESISVFALSADSYFEFKNMRGLHWGIGFFADIPTGDAIESLGVKFTLFRE